MLNLAIQDVEEIALRAGELILTYFNPGSGIPFERKRDNSPVTEADIASQKYINEALQALTPGIPILGEELSVGEKEMQIRGLESETCWIVDPLDGTHNFASGIDLFCVSICLMENGVPAAGVIYDPVRKDMYSALRGNGARLNGRRLSTAGIKEYRDYALFVHMRRLSPPLRKFVSEWLTENIERIREIGSLALKLAWIACGKYDGNIQGWVNFWDSSAGILLIQEAGGICTDFYGNPILFIPGDRHDLLVSANLHLHTWLKHGIKRYTASI